MPIITILHELGHAIPALILTRQKVEIFLGSYGDKTKSLHFNIGLLQVWFRYNPFTWYGGFCLPSAKHISLNKQIFYTLTGPLTSISIATLTCYFFFSFKMDLFFQYVLIIFLSYALIDFVYNLYPRNSPVFFKDGRPVYNDGHNILRLFRYKKFPKGYNAAVDLYNEKKYTEAWMQFQQMLDDGAEASEIYQLALTSATFAKKYSEAKSIAEKFISFGKLSADDYSIIGFAFNHLHQHEEALLFYDKSLELDPVHTYSLNNKGFSMNLAEKYEEALPVLDKAIELNPTFAFAYSNRGLTRIKLGQLEEGLADIQYSISLDEENSYAYMHFGVYHFEKRDYRQALAFFNKAKNMDAETAGIDKLILDARGKL